MNPEDYKHPFARSVALRLQAAGLNAQLLSSAPVSASFGNSEATFRWGPLILHFVKDRGQELVDIAMTGAPDRFFLIDDLDVAMNWRSVDEVLAKRQPEKLDAIFARLADHASELNDAFSGAREPLTRAKLQRAERERGEAFMARLRGKRS